MNRDSLTNIPECSKSIFFRSSRTAEDKESKFKPRYNPISCPIDWQKLWHYWMLAMMLQYKFSYGVRKITLKSNWTIPRSADDAYKHDPTIPLQNIPPKTLLHMVKKMFIKVIIAALFIIRKNWKYSKFPSKKSIIVAG